jgi:tRNA threonylcarbamoyl adenosine modification protein YeaZ
MTVLPDTFLVIESGVLGGSVALFRSGVLAGSHLGNGERSRSEDLLPVVAHVLAEAGAEAGELEAIYFSRGPGSFTGIRIGIATALGLRDSLNISVHGISLFDALRFVNVQEDAPCMIAVPVGRKDAAWAEYLQGTPDPTFAAGPIVDLGDKVKGHEHDKIVLHPVLFPPVGSTTATTMNPNLAESIGEAVMGGLTITGGLEPIYLSNSNLNR